MRGDEAKKKCPIIELVSVPNVREKADLSKYVLPNWSTYNIDKVIF